MAHRQQVNAATRRQSLAIAYGDTGHVAPYAADITDVRALICTTPRYRLVTNVGCEAIVSKRRSWVVCQANALSRSCKLAREFRGPRFESKATHQEQSCRLGSSHHAATIQWHPHHQRLGYSAISWFVCLFVLAGPAQEQE